MIKKLFGLSIIGLLSIASITNAHAGCPDQEPFGRTFVHGGQGMCHQGYYAIYSHSYHLPLFVSWGLTSEHAMGCNHRFGSFMQDPLAKSMDVPPSAYAHSGYDRGHIADANDFNWDPKEQSESFYMTNMTPQAPGLNRGAWKWLEDSTRDWAVSRHAVWIYAGPVVKTGDKTFSNYNIDVPTAYWKIIMDPVTKNSIAFIMPNHKIPKDQIPSTIVSVYTVEQTIGFGLAMPSWVDRSKVSSLDEWKLNPSEYHSSKALKCEVK